MTSYSEWAKRMETKKSPIKSKSEAIIKWGAVIVICGYCVKKIIECGF